MSVLDLFEQFELPFRVAEKLTRNAVKILYRTGIVVARTPWRITCPDRLAGHMIGARPHLPGERS